MNASVASLEQIKSTVIDLAIRFGPKLLVALLIIGAGIAVSRWVSRWLGRGLTHLQLEPPVQALLVRLAWLLTFALFVVMALQNLGVELLPLVAGVGVAGAGIALAMQGVLGNLVAGLSIIFSKPFRIGEYISIIGEEGQVESVTLFSTTLTHLDRSRVVIPNRKIVGEILHNFGTVRQIEILVGVGYGTDLEQALQAIGEVLRSNPRVLQEPAPLVQTAGLGDSAVTIAIRPWVGVTDYRVANGEINKAVLEMFRQRGISIPFPQREVRLLGST